MTSSAKMSSSCWGTYRRATQLVNLAGDRVPTLLCYESAKDIEAGTKWCHRHIVAQWLEDTLGLLVEEVNFPTLDRWAYLRKEGVAPPHYQAAPPAIAVNIEKAPPPETQMTMGFG